MVQFKPKVPMNLWSHTHTLSKFGEFIRKTKTSCEDKPLVQLHFNLKLKLQTKMKISPLKKIKKR